MTNKIIMADGTQIGCDFCGLSALGTVYMDVKMTFAEAAAAFGDRTRTETLTYEAGEEQRVFTGYTVLNSLDLVDGATRVGMRRRFEGE